MSSPLSEASPGVFLVDTGYVRPRLAASYVVRGAGSAAIIETGTTRSVPGILAALSELRIGPADVSHVVVTHVHLDHAGGAGALLQALPRAALVVHPRGARHMIDPAKLQAGTAEVYGAERFAELYGQIVPAAAKRVVEAPEGFTFDLGNRRLRCLDAPGHARHHLAVFDESTRGVFTGDTFGISYRETDSAKGPLLFPTTTPVQLDPSALHATIDRVVALEPQRLYLTHYGVLEGDLARLASSLHAALDEHVRIARAAPAGPRRHGAIRDGLAAQLLAAHEGQGSRLDAAQVLELFAGDLELNAQGLEVWIEGERAAATGAGRKAPSSRT